jgi:hypothetical protein
MKFRQFFKRWNNKKILLCGLIAFAFAAGGIVCLESAKKIVNKNISEKNGSQNGVVNVNNSGTINTVIVESPEARAKKPENFPATEKPQEPGIPRGGQFADASHQVATVSANAVQTNSIETKTPATIAKSVQAILDTSRLISMSIGIPGPNRDQTNKITIVCEFSYYEPGDVIPELDASFLKINARNIVARIYNKTAKMNRLQWELDELADVPPALMRPKSMNLRRPTSMSQMEAMKAIEKSLDENIAPLQDMLADSSPVSRQLVFAH